MKAPKTSYSSRLEELLNFALFPYKAFIQNPNESGGRLMCLRDERMARVREHCRGRVLDLGCGPRKVFITHFWDGEGQAVDFFAYEGLEPDDVISGLPLPFADASFDTVTLIANVNHIPQSIFQREMDEIGRVLKRPGRVVITRIGYLVSLLTHSVVKIQSKISKKYQDMDSDRGMEEDERWTVPVEEIAEALTPRGFRLSRRRRLWTQWWLNEILVFDRD